MIQQINPQSEAPDGDPGKNAFNLLDDVNRQLEAIFGSADRVALVHDAVIGLITPYNKDPEAIIALFARPARTSSRLQPK